MAKNTSGFVTLPNGDIWQPKYAPEEAEDSVDIGAPIKVDAAEALKDRTDCPWCGLECRTKPALKIHAEAKHKAMFISAEDQLEDAAVAAASARA